MANSNMNANVFSIELSDKQIDLIAQLQETRGNKSAQEIIEQALAHGLSNLAYRTERNKRVYAETKAEIAENNAMREELRRLRAQAENSRVVVANGSGN